MNCAIGRMAARGWPFVPERGVWVSGAVAARPVVCAHVQDFQPEARLCTAVHGPGEGARVVSLCASTRTVTRPPTAVPRYADSTTQGRSGIQLGTARRAQRVEFPWTHLYRAWAAQPQRADASGYRCRTQCRAGGTRQPHRPGGIRQARVSVVRGQSNVREFFMGCGEFVGLLGVAIPPEIRAGGAREPAEAPNPRPIV